MLDCGCSSPCFLCALEDLDDVGKKRIGKPIDGREQAVLYWSERIGCKPGEQHPTVREAVLISPSLCDRAWARLRDKEMDASNRDLSNAVRVRNRQAFFVWALKEYIAEAYAERHAKKMRSYEMEEATRRNAERRQAAINRRTYQ
jgi:hypothetical protein